jgi:beta-1,4-mannosyl-glycoprotein beta-1,4-N-acetylglucosaminyltransferase
MKIIDCFTFYNELQLLTYRLAILDDIVDYFVIVEATHTFTGHEKELYFEKNKETFSKYIHKIIHIVVDDFEYKQPNINFSKNQQWINEYFQRNCITRGINKIILKDEDIIIISDLDEISDPETLSKIKNNEIKISINALEQDVYYYNLNSKFTGKWTLSKILSYKNFKTLNKTCDQIRNTKCISIEKCGWHLSYFGDPFFIANKIKHFSHQELNNSNFTDCEKIKNRIVNCGDLYDRADQKLIKLSISENTYLPIKYDEYLIGFFK